MLTLIGLGLNDENDMTLKGIEAAKKSDKVFAELYTGLWHGNKGNLEKIIGKKIIEVDRKDLEDNSKIFLQNAKKYDIALLIQGDPLVATSHGALIVEARKMKIRTEVIHNSSIFSAVGETGLHIYKFGPAITIPFREKTGNKLPESIYNIIAENRKKRLHTLCLLDVVAEKHQYMSANEALEILFEMEKEFKKGCINEDFYAIVFENAGGAKSKVTFAKISELVKKKFENFPQVLILTGHLHFTEKEFLNS